MTFRSIYSHGLARVAACTIKTSLADPVANMGAVIDVARRCHERAVAFAVFPELCVSGYSIDDLLLQDALLDAVVEGVEALIEGSRELMTLLLVGAPLRHGARIYNCAVAIHRGRLLGVVPKTYLPNYREFYERRHFASGAACRDLEIAVGRYTAPFGVNLLFEAEDAPGFVVHAEVCEDLWVPIPPSSVAALAGATILANLSASNITIGKADTRRLLSQSQSSRCIAAYLYAAAGAGESTTDLAWDGQTSIFENGALLTESVRFPGAEEIALADVDLDLLRQERARQGTFDDNARDRGASAEGFQTVMFRLDPPPGDVGLERSIERFPFVPAKPERLAQDCYEAYNIQVFGLKQRLSAIKVEHVVIGVSGGLDSTHALIVAAKAFDLLGLPRTNILAYTMPGFATGDDTKQNAHRLMASLGVSAHELDIRAAATQMLKDIDHPYSRGAPQYDVTFENVQAGLRTDYLFRLANHHNAIVLGTGDLSELALGWCTYGVGDQMSHYNVNAGVPKTLIQHLIRWVISARQFAPEVGEVLGRHPQNGDLARTRARVEAGAMPQSTEARVGPYELQDFNLFYILRYGFRPSKIAFLAMQAWGNVAAGAWPPGFPERQRRLRSGPNTSVAGNLPAALLRLQPVQALGYAERTQGLSGWFAVPPRRLARPVRRQRRRLARRAGGQCAKGIISSARSDPVGASRNPKPRRRHNSPSHLSFSGGADVLKWHCFPPRARLSSNPLASLWSEPYNANKFVLSHRAPRTLRISSHMLQIENLAVVTGAGGFIGGHLVGDLLEKGFKRIRAVDFKPLSEWYQRFELGRESQARSVGHGKLRDSSAWRRIYFQSRSGHGRDGFHREQ